MIMTFAFLNAKYACRRMAHRVLKWLAPAAGRASAGAEPVRQFAGRAIRFGPAVLALAIISGCARLAGAAVAAMPVLLDAAVKLFWTWPRAAFRAGAAAWARYRHRRELRHILHEAPEPAPVKAKPRFSSEPFPAMLARKAASPAFTMLTILGAAGLIWWSYTLPKPVDTYPLSATLAAPAERELLLLTASGEPFARRGGCYGAPVARAELPEHFVDALLAMEDRRFYSHFGIDPAGVARAALANYEAERIVQGGSTITQQLAKISYLNGEKTVERKLEEAVAVLRLEANLTKDQILQRYLSRAYFGEGCYGLRAAARHYFERPVDRLTLAQSAMLVALLKSPTAVTSAPERLKERARLVLQSMAQTGTLDREAAEATEPAEPMIGRRKSAGDFYADWIADTIELPDDGKMSTLPVRTAYEPKLQKSAEEAVAAIMKRGGKARRASQAALVAMRPNGQVVAMAGGMNYGQSQFNRATQALRQPGSSFKSFVYLAALRAGGRPDMMVVDEPIRIGDWMPENYNRNYRGVVTLRQAFSSSINTVAVRLSEAVGREQVVRAAKDMGIGSKLHAGPSIALGTSEVTLLELTSAYAAFAANAYPVKPWGVLGTGENTNRRGAPPEGAGRWKLDESETMRDFLSATVQYGTGRGARLRYPSFGKTGTSQNYRDAWFIGFAGNLVVGVWVGNDDNSAMAGVTGGNLPAMIWARFMRQAGESDPDFSTQVPTRIAGFDPRPNPQSRQYAMHGGLQSLLVSERYMAESGSYFGYGPYGRRPMALGYDYQDRPPRPRFRERQRERQYERRHGRHDRRRENSRRVYRRIFGGGW